MKPQTLEAFAAFIGLDWADATHDICLQAAGSDRRELLVLEHRPEAIDAWVQTLRTRFNGHPVAVCPELNHGPLVSALRPYDWSVTKICGGRDGHAAHSSAWPSACSGTEVP
jgi:hypothetical protein